MQKATENQLTGVVPQVAVREQVAQAAQAHNIALSSFLASTSHDMRSSIQVLQSNAECMTQSLKSKVSSAEFIKEASSTASLQLTALSILRHIVDNAMDASKAMLGRIECNYTQVPAR